MIDYEIKPLHTKYHCLLTLQCTKNTIFSFYPTIQDLESTLASIQGVSDIEISILRFELAPVTLIPVEIKFCIYEAENINPGSVMLEVQSYMDNILCGYIDHA